MAVFYLNKIGKILRGDNGASVGYYNGWNIFIEQGRQGGYYVYLTHPTRFNEWGYAFDNWLEKYEDIEKYLEHTCFEIDWGITPTDEKTS